MKNWIKIFVVIFTLTGLVWSCNDNESFWDAMIPETDKDPTTTQINGYVFKPALVPATHENVQQLKVPAGFKVNKFAENLGKPRILVVSPTGYVYASDRDSGTVTLLQDTNNDGSGDHKSTVANIKQVHGLAIRGNQMYMVAVRELYVANINPDGTLGAPQLLLNDLPDAGQHPNRTIAFGPDDKLYITVGSTCNSCPGPNRSLIKKMQPFCKLIPMAPIA